MQSQVLQVWHSPHSTHSKHQTILQRDGMDRDTYCHMALCSESATASYATADVSCITYVPLMSQSISDASLAL